MWSKIKKAKKGAKALYKYSGAEWLHNQIKNSAFLQSAIKIVAVGSCIIATGGSGAPVCAGVAAGTSTGLALLNGASIGDALKAGTIAGATALAFMEVGGMDLQLPGKLLAHGLVGGASAKASGGSFQSGFLAGGVTAGINGTFETNDIVLGTVRLTIAGGVGAELGGGKFANGAQTGAFSYLFYSSQTTLRRVINKVGRFADSFSADVLARKVDHAMGIFEDGLFNEGDPDLLDRFENWKVNVNVGRNISSDGIGVASTRFRTQSTTFYRDFGSLTVDNQVLTVAHEFRHLMPANNALNSNRVFLTTPHGQRPVEIDAENWAKEFIRRNY